jgi:hypothetical protein
MPRVYERLRERLDDPATGFPLSKSQVESGAETYLRIALERGKNLMPS